MYGNPSHGTNSANTFNWKICENCDYELGNFMSFTYSAQC